MRLDENLYESMVSIVNSPEMARIKDMALTAHRKQCEKNGQAIPSYLLQYCRSCGTYRNVVPTLRGLQCTLCSSKAHERTLPKKIVRYANIFSKNGQAIRTLTKLHQPSVLLAAAAYSVIAKRQGYKIWRVDRGCEVGGYYENEAGERAYLSTKEIPNGSKSAKPVGQPRAK